MDPKSPHNLLDANTIRTDRSSYWKNAALALLFPSCVTIGWYIGDDYSAILRKQWFTGVSPIVSSPGFVIVALLAVVNFVGLYWCLKSMNIWPLLTVFLSSLLGGLVSWFLFFAYSVV